MTLDAETVFRYITRRRDSGRLMDKHSLNQTDFGASFRRLPARSTASSRSAARPRNLAVKLWKIGGVLGVTRAADRTGTHFWSACSTKGAVPIGRWET